MVSLKQMKARVRYKLKGNAENFLIALVLIFSS